MAHDVISTCPVCEHELAVTRLHCSECGTTLEGNFSVGRFGRLNREQLSLLESFLRSRGNLREMERELGLSYPTIRGRVETLVKALGLGGAPVEPEPFDGSDARGSDAAATDTAGSDAPAAAAGAPNRRDILERLSRHEISAVDAAAALRSIGSAAEVGARE